MRFIVNCVVLFCLMTKFAVADCNWGKIQKNSDNTYTYTAELHLCVGELIRDTQLKDKQIDHLKKAIELSDLALTKSQAQNQSWMESSLKVQEEMRKYESASELSGWIKFGLGVAVTTFAFWGAGQLRR
jgi:hypothetical protein